MFIDLRGSTRLGEGRLPYDVVFILNQFFADAPMSNPTTTGPILPQPWQSTLYSSYPSGGALKPREIQFVTGPRCSPVVAGTGCRYRT